MKMMMDMMNSIFLVDISIILILVFLPFSYSKTKNRFDRTKYLTKFQRQDLGYGVLETKSMVPRVDLKRWEWVTGRILEIGNFWHAWDWLTDNFYDADLVITGIKGSAKTSIGLKIAKDKTAQRDVAFSVKYDVLTGRIVILTPELIADDIVPYSVKFIDEIQHCFNRMRTSSTINVEANRFMDLKRKWKVNVIGTMPQITSAESYLINEKFRFWINCYHNVKRKKYSKTFVWVNAHSKDGKYRDWIKLEERVFYWAPTKLYNAATRKWKSEHSDVRNLEDYKDRALKILSEKKRKQTNQRIRDILGYNFLSIKQKAYLFFDMDISRIKIENYLKSFQQRSIQAGTLKKVEEDYNINKNFIYACESDIDVRPELIEQASSKILQFLKVEREKQ